MSFVFKIVAALPCFLHFCRFALFSTLLPLCLSSAAQLPTAVMLLITGLHANAQYNIYSSHPRGPFGDQFQSSTPGNIFPRNILPRNSLHRNILSRGPAFNDQSSCSSSLQQTQKNFFERRPFGDQFQSNAPLLAKLTALTFEKGCC